MPKQCSTVSLACVAGNLCLVSGHLSSLSFTSSEYTILLKLNVDKKKKKKNNRNKASQRKSEEARKLYAK